MISLRPVCVLVVAILVGCSSSVAPASPTATPVSAVAPRDGASTGPELLGGPPRPRPAQPAMAVRYATPLVSDHCVDRDLAVPPTDNPVLTVLDRTYGLPATFVPGDLVPASEAGFDGSSGAMLVSRALVEDLRALRTATVADGLVLQIESGYRSYDDQLATLAAWVGRIGFDGAAARAARAGHSEHQLGTALDLVSPGWSGRFGDWAVESAEGAWMADHAWEYGFVMSYPADGSDETCYGYEPWHYRWIGREAASEHRASGLSLREFLVRYVDR